MMDKDYKLKYSLDWIQCTGVQVANINLLFQPATNAVTMTVLKNP